MYKEHQRYYLQQMGINPWLIRENDSNQHALYCLENQVEACTRCPLHETRRKTVFARGNPKGRLMIIGEAPGFHEDQQGLPFVGKAGRLLNKMIASIGLSEEDVYIANIIKCRPADNRDPKPEEIDTCHTYLVDQIKLVNPNLILAVGRFSGQFLINKSLPLNKMRDKQYNYHGKSVIVSYHPAYLLRNPSDKKKAYSDLLRVHHLLNAE